jgi:hypothetical protein
MFLRIERGHCESNSGPEPVELVELVSPRTNSASYTPIEHVFAALSRKGGVAFEIGGDATARRFYARLAGPSLRGLLDAQISAAYPQARGRAAARDPALRATDEQVAISTLELREPEYLPLRILRDPEIATDRSPQADPLLGVLAALGNMPPGWRGVAQLVLQPALEGWARRHLRRTLEHALEPERAERARGSSASSAGWSGVLMGLALLLAVMVLPRLWAIYLERGWLPVILLAIPAAIVLGALYALWIRLSDRPLYDLELVKEKLARPVARAELRLAVFAPETAESDDVQAKLDHLVAAYRAYDLQRGNGLVGRSHLAPESAEALCTPTPLQGARRLATLSTRELAGLWHLVQAGDDVAFVERTTARRFLPLPEAVADGARIGVAEDGLGHSVAVHLAPALLRRHALLVAKTRKGKSGLLRHVFQQLVLVETPSIPAVVLVDPHSDLAQQCLGLVPAARHDKVVFLDVAQGVNRPFGLNLLDVGLGWNRDQLVENALRVFKHEFDNFWGPRMELVFRMALLLLVDANERLVRADPTGGRDRQFTILEVPRVLEDDYVRRGLLAEVTDVQIQALWRTYFNPLDRRFRLEIINPVQTKTYKFAANLTARAIVGQSRSTIDPLSWVRDGAVVLVDVAKEQVGADIAAMIGGTLINLLALAVGQQATLEPNERRHVALLVDEFHALPAANYEAFLAELAKYGASLVLATQSLAALDEIDPGRGLRHAVFANVDHLFGFNCSAEDAALVAAELGAPIEPADLVELGDHQCYARLSHRGERLRSFHLRLDPPPSGDAAIQHLLRAQSAARYGRAFAAVAADRAALVEAIDAHDSSDQDASGTGRANVDPESGRLPPSSAGSVAPSVTLGARRRNEGRRTRSTSRPNAQPALVLDFPSPILSPSPSPSPSLDPGSDQTEVSDGVEQAGEAAANSSDSGRSS